jgi:hypothetical protein
LRSCYLRSDRAIALRPQVSDFLCPLPWPLSGSTLYLVRLSVTSENMTQVTHSNVTHEAVQLFPLPITHEPILLSFFQSPCLTLSRLPPERLVLLLSSDFQSCPDSPESVRKMHEEGSSRPPTCHPATILQLAYLLLKHSENTASSSILVVLQQQFQELNQSQSSDERLTKWLEPTVKVLYTFSETLGEGVSLYPVISKCSRSEFSYLL